MRAGCDPGTVSQSQAKTLLILPALSPSDKRGFQDSCVKIHRKGPKLNNFLNLTLISVYKKNIKLSIVVFVFLIKLLFVFLFHYIVLVYVLMSF